MKHTDRIIFTNNSQSDRGIMSVVLAVISTCSVVFGFIYSYVRSGEVVHLRFAAGLIMALVFSITGLVLGVLSLSETDRFKFLPMTGVIINSLDILALGTFLWIGLS